MHDDVPRGLRVAAAYSWRLLVVGALIYAVLVLLVRLELVAIAIFIGLVITALVGPLVRLLQRIMPRGLAVALGWPCRSSCCCWCSPSSGPRSPTRSPPWAGSSARASRRSRTGCRTARCIGTPLGSSSSAKRPGTWIAENQSKLAESAIGGAGRVAEGSRRCSSRLHLDLLPAGGERIWGWLSRWCPSASDRGSTALVASPDHVRRLHPGIVVVAGTNAVPVAIGLTVLRVPLSVPLALLVFFGSFIPIIGAPIAMIVAAVVALAAQGPLVALGWS